MRRGWYSDFRAINNRARFPVIGQLLKGEGVPNNILGERHPSFLLNAKYTGIIARFQAGNHRLFFPSLFSWPHVAIITIPAKPYGISDKKTPLSSRRK
jgi:hypothetical protein